MTSHFPKLHGLMPPVRQIQHEITSHNEHLLIQANDEVICKYYFYRHGVQANESDQMVVIKYSGSCSLRPPIQPQKNMVLK